MEGMLLETDALPGAITGTACNSAACGIAASIGKLLEEHRGGNVTVLDLQEMNAWTDFFVIASASSGAHMDGMERHIKEFCREQEIEILRRSRKPAGIDDEWRLIDLGHTVIHLMSSRSREFYELERLYSEAKELRFSGVPTGHSSMSSKSSS